MRRKKQVNKFPAAFRKMALERLKSCRNVTELSAELGIHRTQLYKWRDQMEPIEDGPGPAANTRERELRSRDLLLHLVYGSSESNTNAKEVGSSLSRALIISWLVAT